jgi:hypothetical protein
VLLKDCTPGSASGVPVNGAFLTALPGAARALFSAADGTSGV